MAAKKAEVVEKEVNNQENNMNTKEEVIENSTIYKLIKPIQFDGAEVTELNLDFDNLNGLALMACSKQAARLDPEAGMSLPVRALSMAYQMTVAAKAARVVPELIQQLGGKDFTMVTQKAANFLLAQD